MKILLVLLGLSSICFNVWAVALPEGQNSETVPSPSLSCETQLKDALKRIEELEKESREKDVDTETATAISKIILTFISKKLGY